MSGPRWRSGSVFGTGPRRPIDADQRLKLRAWAYEAQRKGMICRGTRDLMLGLLRRTGADGGCFPSHATLAAELRCHERTVRTWLATLRDCKALTWTRRMVRDGWRAVQTSSAYVFGDPPPIVAASGGRNARGIKEKKENKGMAAVSVVAQALAMGWKGTQEQARNALAERARLITERMRNVVAMKMATSNTT